MSPILKNGFRSFYVVLDVNALLLMLLVAFSVHNICVNPVTLLMMNCCVPGKTGSFDEPLLQGESVVSKILMFPAII